jgi:hypothetical protein
MRTKKDKENGSPLSRGLGKEIRSPIPRGLGKEIRSPLPRGLGTVKGMKNHKITNPELPKIISDDNVETALYNRAVGMLIPETIETDNDKGKSTKITFKYQYPDVSACIFWLKNKLPEKWKDTKTDIEEKESFKDFIEKFGKELVEEVEGKKKNKK